MIRLRFQRGVGLLQIVLGCSRVLYVLSFFSSMCGPPLATKPKVGTVFRLFRQDMTGTSPDMSTPAKDLFILGTAT